MFGSKKIEELEKRLHELEGRFERHQSDVATCRNFEVHSDTEKEWVSSFGMGHYQVPKSQRIAIKDVVQKILDHLGMRLVYIEGKPTTVDMQKKSKG